MGNCWKCKGTGTIERYKHIENGKCFACGGDGNLSAADKKRIAQEYAAKGAKRGGKASHLAKTDHTQLDRKELEAYRKALMREAKKLGLKPKAGFRTDSLKKQIQEALGRDGNGMASGTAQKAQPEPPKPKPTPKPSPKPKPSPETDEEKVRKLIDSDHTKLDRAGLEKYRKALAREARKLGLKPKAGFQTNALKKKMEEALGGSGKGEKEEEVKPEPPKPAPKPEPKKEEPKKEEPKKVAPKPTAKPETLVGGIIKTVKDDRVTNAGDSSWLSTEIEGGVLSEEQYKKIKPIVESTSSFRNAEEEKQGYEGIKQAVTALRKIPAFKDVDIRLTLDNTHLSSTYQIRNRVGGTAFNGGDRTHVTLYGATNGELFDKNQKLGKVPVALTAPSTAKTFKDFFKDTFIHEAVHAMVHQTGKHDEVKKFHEEFTREAMKEILGDADAMKVPEFLGEIEELMQMGGEDPDIDTFNKYFPSFYSAKTGEELIAEAGVRYMRGEKLHPKLKDFMETLMTGKEEPEASPKPTKKNLTPEQEKVRALLDELKGKKVVDYSPDHIRLIVAGREAGIRLPEIKPVRVLMQMIEDIHFGEQEETSRDLDMNGRREKEREYRAQGAKMDKALGEGITKGADGIFRNKNGREIKNPLFADVESHKNIAERNTLKPLGSETMQFDTSVAESELRKRGYNTWIVKEVSRSFNEAVTEFQEKYPALVANTMFNHLEANFDPSYGGVYRPDIKGGKYMMGINLSLFAHAYTASGEEFNKRLAHAKTQAVRVLLHETAHAYHHQVLTDHSSIGFLRREEINLKPIHNKIMTMHKEKQRKVMAELAKNGINLSVDELRKLVIGQEGSFTYTAMTAFAKEFIRPYGFYDGLELLSTFTEVDATGNMDTVRTKYPQVYDLLKEAYKGVIDL